MRRLVFALIASLGLTAATAINVIGDVSSDTEAILSCSNDTSVAADVDSATLLNLTQEVQALATDPTGLQCTLSQDSSASPSASWTVYDRTPGNGIKPRVSADSGPATTSGDTVSFPFLQSTTFTALLTTTDSGLTGNLCPDPSTNCKTLNDTVSVTDMSTLATFQDENNGGCLPDRKSVRFYFTSPQGAGTTGPGTTGFYTQFWWSNPVSVTLENDGVGGVAPTTIRASLADPAEWSDFHGQSGVFNSEVTDAFFEATQNVKSIGLSFGGGCFFENGVTTSDGSGTFNSTFSESS